MDGLAAAPLLALLTLGVACGIAALAVVIAGSDLRPSEYPRPKNNAQTPTRPKNRTSNLPVPSVISVSSDEAIAPLQNWRATHHRPIQFLGAFRRRRISTRGSQKFLQSREEVHRHGEDHS